jgi:hypothetical protein
MTKLFVTFIASLMFIALTGCSDHSHDDGSHSHDAPEHHDTLK